MFKEKRSPLSNAVLWIIVAIMLALIGVGAYFITKAYFVKDDSAQGYIRFAPGIYIEFDNTSVKIDENDKTNWKLLYYKDNNLENDPTEFNTTTEPATPMKSYSVVSPKFKSGKDGNDKSSPFVARAKVEYFDENGTLLSNEILNYLFSQEFEDESYKGILLEFDSSWKPGNNGYYYYVGSKSTQETLTSNDLEEIDYNENAEYIKIFKTNENDVAVIRFANQSPESYQDLGLTSIKIVLTMDFSQLGSDEVAAWFN